ncbi:zinc transporter ZIP4-like [Festucalex cinctus]
MTSFTKTLLVFSALTSWCALGSVSACPAVDEAYGAVVNLVRPGQQHLLLDEESLVALFNTLENRVQCEEVPCGKCNLSNAVHQLLHNHSDHRQAGAVKNRAIDAAGFSALAAGCVLYLSSPDKVCAAAGQGRWGEEVERFLHEIASGNSHEHHHEGEEVDGESCHGHEHQHVGLGGLESVFRELLKHYEPSEIENCMTTSDIMSEVGASSAEQTQAAGAVLGRVLYHALRGQCFQSLPEESFFLDDIMHRLGSENFTIEGSQKKLKLNNKKKKV